VCFCPKEAKTITKHGEKHFFKTMKTSGLKRNLGRAFRGFMPPFQGSQNLITFNPDHRLRHVAELGRTFSPQKSVHSQNKVFKKDANYNY